MRQELLDYIQELDLGTFQVSKEIPWNESGTGLHLRNPKRIYVDVDQYATEPFLSTLGGLSISNQVTSVRVIFSADAKKIPSNYDDLIIRLRQGKDINTIEGVVRRECDVNTEVINDLLVTELEYRFTKLST